MEAMPTSTAIALIGAGPLGIELGVALKKAKLDYIHLEAGQIGATMLWWAPGTRWFSSNERIAIAGVPLVTVNNEKATREEYLSYLTGVVRQFYLRIETYTRVDRIQKQGEKFLITAQSSVGGADLGPERQYLADKVILATGGTAKANLLGIPGEKLSQVSHYFSEPHVYFNHRVLVVGGKNSAVEAAIRCHRAGAKVIFSYRGEAVDKERIKYWLYPEFSSLIKSGAIESHFQTVPVKIAPGHVVLQSNRGSGELQDVRADFVLLMTGYLADMSLAEKLGVQLEGLEQRPKLDERTMETNVPGVYVAGTAVAGTQFSYKVFLENCHIHVERIMAHLMHKEPPATPELPERAES